MSLAMNKQGCQHQQLFEIIKKYMKTENWEKIEQRVNKKAWMNKAHETSEKFQNSYTFMSFVA